jgi:hypothetical protein
MATGQCKGCSQATKPYTSGKARTWCSVACRRKNRYRIRWKEGYRRKRGPFQCQNCKKEHYSGRPIGEGEKYCSRKCAFIDRAIRLGKRKAERLQRLNEGRRQRRLVREEAARERKAVEERRLSQRHRDCRICGQSFLLTHGNTTLCLSDSCREQARKLTNVKSRRSLSSKRHKRIYRSRRRAIERGIGADRIDPLAVFHRDGWRCKLCGCKTPRHLRGSYDDRAPELDHVVPLSLGGAHTQGNVQCSCRKCNGLKGARALG